MSGQKIILVLTINFFLFFGFTFHALSDEADTLAEKEKQTLLKISRNTLMLYLNKQIKPQLPDYLPTSNLKKKYGVFVTLKEKSTENLRGCMGYIRGYKPLAEAVIDCTIQAATQDKRFLPMKRGEDHLVDIEISVLTTPRTIKKINEIKIGAHGLILSQGYKTGVLLPQVPVEWGWNRDDFLKAICRKAGLPDKAWENGAELQAFSALVFAEKHVQ